MLINDYAEYVSILRAIKETGKLCFYNEALNRDRFIVLRHDIEFSVEKAYQMAQVEFDNDIKSTYFVQIGNDAYNAFSDSNKRLITEIHNMGHEIGLHYRQSNVKTAVSDIRFQMAFMKEFYEFNINSFSTHRPKKETQYEAYDVPSALNAYGSDFFTKTNDVENVKVKYISDSKFQWNYGYPSLETLRTNAKIQLLVHPFQWGDKTADIKERFEELFSDAVGKMKANYINEFSPLQEVNHGRKILDIQA